ncbi:hypothetical protein BGZ94_005230 [Podila epigama]|nr:hypothetical protein BGZ94_005230 [Podila epigama]
MANFSEDSERPSLKDLTADSAFLTYTSDTEFRAIMSDFPTSDNVPTEVDELSSLLGLSCSYEVLRDRVFATPPNTPIRRFLFKIIESYSRYFPRHNDVPSLMERQAMFDLLCPFIRSALFVYEVESVLSEIPIVGSGLRKNSSKDPSDKLSKCRLADITGEDRVGATASITLENTRILLESLELFELLEALEALENNVL